MLAVAPRSPMPPRPQRPDRLRLAHRLAAGVPRARAAAAEGIAEPEVDALLERPDFAELLDAVRRLRDLPHEERVAQLVDTAWTVLQLAVADGDVRAVIFVLHERGMRRDPCRTLAVRAVAAARRHSARPEPGPPAGRPQAPCRPPGPPDPARWARDAAARLRGRLLREHALKQPPRVGPAPEAGSPRPVPTTKPASATVGGAAPGLRGHGAADGHPQASARRARKRPQGP